MGSTIRRSRVQQRATELLDALVEKGKRRGRRRRRALLSDEERAARRQEALDIIVDRLPDLARVVVGLAVDDRNSAAAMRALELGLQGADEWLAAAALSDVMRQIREVMKAEPVEGADAAGPADADAATEAGTVEGAGL